LAQIAQALEEINLPGAWITIGSFDGVHLGHQALVSGLVAGAHQAGAPVVVLTFYPHPAAVLRGLRSPIYLTPPDERARLLGDLGVDAVVTLPFDRAMAALTAEEFMRQLKRHLALRQLWVGANFALGRNREGDVPALQRLGAAMDYHVEVVAPVKLGDEIISSSAVRSVLAAGEVERAARFLGRAYAMQGEVVHGDGRGRGLGIPTANLAAWSEQVTPANGVYACWAWLDGQRWQSAVSIGLRPTFESQDDNPRIEAYLMDFDGDIYGQTLRLEFAARLREERRYASVESLMDQVKQDIVAARSRLV
jgi:riboflavin kinase/FMN adenylyltransferase